MLETPQHPQTPSAKPAQPKKRLPFSLKTIAAFCAGVGLTLIVFLGINLVTKFREKGANSIDYQTIIDFGAYVGDLDPSWTITPADPSISEIDFKSNVGFDGRTAVLHFHQVGANDFTLTSPSGEVFIYTVSIDQDKNVEVYRR